MYKITFSPCTDSDMQEMLLEFLIISLGCFERPSLNIAMNAVPYITQRASRESLLKKAKQTVEERGRGALIASIDCTIKFHHLYRPALSSRFLVCSLEACKCPRRFAYLP